MDVFYYRLPLHQCSYETDHKKIIDYQCSYETDHKKMYAYRVDGRDEVKEHVPRRRDTHGDWKCMHAMHVKAHAGAAVRCIGI